MASEACRTLPAVVTTDYKLKGITMQLGSLKTYMTLHAGNQQGVTKGIIDVYDVFGNVPQTFQGADMLAERLNAVVIVPDFFKGESLPADTVPVDTDEKKQMAAKFMADQADIPKNTQTLLQTAVDVKKQWPSVKNWGAFGPCWGGKIAVLASAEGSPIYRLWRTAHPGRLNKEEALKLTIRHIVLALPDELADIVNEYTDIFKSGDKVGEVETYHTMFHGWMGARANLQNRENAKEFERGYNQVANFFGKYL